MGRKRNKKKGGASNKTAGQGKQPSSMVELAKREIRRATSAVAAEEYGEAIRHFSQGLLLGHDNKEIVVQILVARAALWVLLRSYEDAATDSAVAVSLDRTTVTGWLRYALALWHLKKYSEAAECVRKGADQITDDAAHKARLKRVEKIVFDKKSDAGQILMAESGLDDLEYDEQGDGGKDGGEPASEIPLQEDHWPEFFDKMPPLVPPENYYTHDYESLIDLEDEMYTTRPADSQRVLAESARQKQLGNTAFGSGDYPNALRHYTMAIRLAPNNHVFYSNRAATCLKLGRLHDAVSDCTTSVRLHPTIKAYARRAASWAAMEEWALSAQDYLSALKFEPRNADVWQQLLNCFTQKEAKLLAESKGSAAAASALRVLRQARDRLEAGGPEGALTSGRKILSL